jgi:transcriptional regulator with XRE-family HTH domain
VPTRPLLKRLAAEVQYLRHERKLTQEDLAHASGISLNTLKHLEWGNSNCQILTLFGVATGLNMPLAKLIAGVEKQE